MAIDATYSTGLPGLDRVLKGLMAGDNVVWQVDSIDDYAPIVQPFWRKAVEQGRKTIYFRFARHAQLIPEEAGVEIRVLHPEDGFETFLDEIHRTIEQSGRGAYYIFDCLSELAVDWYSDRMVGNFFMLTCPYLYDLETITYFALLRDYHSLHATTPIAETTQLLLDVYRHRDDLYIHPLKVQHRYSPTMNMLHHWSGDTFLPVTESQVTADVLTSAARSPLESARSKIGVWNRAFIQAEEMVDRQKNGAATPAKADELFHRILRMLFSRDERVLKLASKYFTLSDLIDIGKRMIGTGLIGGKSVGMLLARAILRRHDPRWVSLLEVHDSFYIGSDVFYTFLVRNGVWWVRQKQKDERTFLEGAEMGRQRILTGSFPRYIEQQFEEMLDYFGQSPIIVRSSSLLEDNFGNAFAGKYDSVFCANQGSRHKRLEDFISAIKTIYASTMSERALSYRARRGLLESDEQMALLVQRVSGGIHGSYFLPQVAGVGFSFNPYVWSDLIESEAGMLRLVFGLGTRAVDRSDDDYTRLVALNAPERRPESDSDMVRQHAQRKVDAIDLEGNLVVSADFGSVAPCCEKMPLHLYASRDEVAERSRRVPDATPNLLLTFDELLQDTPFVEDMREMLRVLQEAYEYPVDVEFTANFNDERNYRINLVQCRPLQVKGSTHISDPPANIAQDEVFFQTRGPVIGQSRIDTLDRVIYVRPSAYGQLAQRDRYSIARIIGQICHARRQEKQDAPFTQILLGPGRWGTTTPSLGIPVSFAEINTVSMLCEIVAMRDDLVPDVSLGTHFFSDIVEMDMLYLALFPQREGSILNESFLDPLPNRLIDVAPRASLYADIIKIVDAADMSHGKLLRLNANSLKQKVICYLE
jgi:hypothetical protein